MPSSSEIQATLCLCGGLIRLLISVLTASLYRRISHVLKPPDVLIRGVTTFLKPGVAASHAYALLQNQAIQKAFAQPRGIRQKGFLRKRL